MSPPHNVTNPSGITLLHTPPSPFFHVHRQMSEDPSPGTTTGKDRDRVDSASRSFSLRHFTHIPPCSPPSPSFLLFFPSLSQASGSRCSFCDYRTFTRVSPRHTPHVTLLSMATLPEARCSLRLELENHCDTSPTTLSLSYTPSLTVMEEKVPIQQCKKIVMIYPSSLNLSMIVLYQLTFSHFFSPLAYRRQS